MQHTCLKLSRQNV